MPDTPNLKSNILPFPSLKAMPPDPKPASPVRGLIALTIVVAALGLLLLTGLALIQL